MYCCFVHKGTMGNIVQCCHTLSNYFKCKDAPAQGEPETSPLLSSNDSECDSLSLPGDLEEDLLTISTGVSNPTLEPENFLFPDIILSSNMAGDVTLVEPMVCLLVSEEEEGMRVDEPGGEGRERINRGRNRGFSEVETQTEAETHIGMGVQTQTELQMHSEMLVCHNETVEREVNTLTNTGNTNKEAVNVWVEHELREQADVLLDAQRGTQTSDRHSEIVTKVSPGKQKTRLDSETLSGINSFVELGVPRRMESQTEKSKLASRDIDKEAEQEELKESHVHEGPTATSTKHTFQTEQNTELNTDGENAFKLQQETNVACAEDSIFPTRENIKDKGQNIENVQPTKYNDINTETVENFDPAGCVDLTQQGGQVNGQMGQETMMSGQNVNGKDYDVIQTQNRNLSEDRTDQTADQSVLNVDHIQRQENWIGDTNRTGLQHVLELEDKEGAETKQMTLLSVDRLFLAGSQVKGAWF